MPTLFIRQALILALFWLFFQVVPETLKTPDVLVQSAFMLSFSIRKEHIATFSPFIDAAETIFTEQLLATWEGEIKGNDVYCFLTFLRLETSTKRKENYILGLGIFIYLNVDGFALSTL